MAAGWFQEKERNAAGQVVDSAVILLTNKECPWRCLMCDLWQHTLTESVPAGAIPRQIHHALAQLAGQPEQIKLYNSGSFFDPAAIPPDDYPAIAAAVNSARHVVVESHPRLVGERTLVWQSLLTGSLEVALGLETIHPEILPRLNKKFTLAHFAEATKFLRTNNIALRVFILVRTPFMTEAEGLDWAVRSAAYAFAQGAAVVSLIPTRPGNGALDRLLAIGEFAPPRLATLERALERVLALPPHSRDSSQRVFADTWNLELFSHCPACFAARCARLHHMNLTQQIPPAVHCAACHEP